MSRGVFIDVYMKRFAGLRGNCVISCAKEHLSFSFITLKMCAPVGWWILRIVEVCALGVSAYEQQQYG